MKNPNLLQKVQYIRSVYPETFDTMSKREVKWKIFLAFGKQEVDRDAKNNSLYKAIKRCKKPEVINSEEGTVKLSYLTDLARKANLWDRIPAIFKKLLLLLIK